MKHPRRRLVDGAGPAGAEDRLPLANDLGLDEEVPERRVQRVCGGRCKNHFRVTRDVNRPACLGAVDDADPAHLGIVLGRNGDFRVRVESVVAAAELHPRLRENRLVLLRLLERRLVRGGPELPACRIADVAERAPVVAGAVFPPACHRDVIPAAVPAARIRDHHVVSFVTITWYLPFDSSCTSGTGVSGVPNERTGISVTPGVVRRPESSAARE